MSSSPSSPHAIHDARLEHEPAIERLELHALAGDVARLWEAVDARSNEPAIVLVATRGEEVYGFLTASSFWHGRSLTLWLNAVAVDERHRRRGIGSALIEELVVRARELGATSVRLRVDPSNEQALALYRAAGFTALAQPLEGDGAEGREIVMRRRAVSERGSAR